MDVPEVLRDFARGAPERLADADKASAETGAQYCEWTHATMQRVADEALTFTNGEQQDFASGSFTLLTALKALPTTLEL